MSEKKLDPRISKAWSLTGWKIGELIKGNKEAVKIVAAFLLGLLTPANPAVQVLVGGISKALLDTLDFYCTDVVLKK